MDIGSIGNRAPRRSGRLARVMSDRVMRRPLALARPFPFRDECSALVRLVPGRLDQAALLALALFAALVAARPWLPAAGDGPLGAFPKLLCAVLTAAMWLRGRGGVPGRDRAAVLIGLSTLCYAIGLLIDTTGGFRGAAQAVPSGADVAYLLLYPLFVGGVLCLPRRRLAAAISGRIALDGVMIMLGALTFSWFFILGPLLLRGQTTGIAAVVAAAYPLGDLISCCCCCCSPRRSGCRAGPGISS